jgi:hypothetical protein
MVVAEAYPAAARSEIARVGRILILVCIFFLNLRIGVSKGKCRPVGPCLWQKIP